MATEAYISVELLAKAQDDSRASVPFFVLMCLSGSLAAVAFLTDSVPILVGSMIIAPLLAPLSLISLGLAFGRWSSVVRGFLISLAGLTVAVAFAVLTTKVLNRLGIVPEGTNLLHKALLEERVRPGWYSVVVGFAAGISSMLGVVRAKVDTLIGAVTSLALVPAGAAGAIALVSGAPHRAVGGFVLLAVNFALIVATGTVTLLLMRRRSAPLDLGAPAPRA